jgi:hypothetical protein
LRQKIDEATAAVGQQPGNAGKPLLEGLQLTNQLIEQSDGASITDETKAALLTNLATKACEFQRAANLALGLKFEVSVDAPAASSAEDAFKAVPGQSFTVTVKLQNQSAGLVEPMDISLTLPAGWQYTKISGQLRAIGANQEASEQFRVMVPADAKYTRPYWHRDDPETEAVNKIDEPRYVTLPLPPPPVGGQVTYRLGQLVGMETGVAKVKFKNTAGEERSTALAVAPAASVAVDPGTQVIPVSLQGDTETAVAIHNNVDGSVDSSLKLQVPANWRVKPTAERVRFDAGANKTFNFDVYPSQLSESRSQLKADLSYRGKNYTEGYTVVTRDDLRVFYYYQPAVQRVSAVEVRLPANLHVGYIMGAGDDIPTVLKQIGMDVTVIAPQQLGTADLSRYGTIVLGINAYTAPPEVKEKNQRLLDYVANGGTLIVQYNQDPEDFNGGHYTPYPAELSHDRVTDEQAPVEILAAQDPVFRFPNQITQRDFGGWVQERGLYFMHSWDPHFVPLLATGDPGEEPLRGGLLEAKYGKGTYIYTGYAFFRQLPAGVPGAVRLFVNLISAGHESK